MSLLNDIKEYMAAQKQKNGPTSQEYWTAQDLLRKQRICDLNKEYKPESKTMVQGYDSEGKWTLVEKTMAEIVADQQKEIDTLLNGLEPEHVGGILMAIRDEKDIANKAIAEKSGNGLEEYTVRASDALVDRFNELQADKENTK